MPSPVLATRLIMLFILTFSRFLGLKHTTQGAFCLNLLKNIQVHHGHSELELYLRVYKQIFIVYVVENVLAPIPVAARSNAWVCGRSLVGIASSNPSWGMGVFRVLSGLCDGQIPRPEESYRVCALVSVIRCNNNPLNVQWLGRNWS
jgi:hypothetical protein